MRPIWYGKKTFVTLKGFMHQGVQFHEGNLFTCDRETYKDFKKYLEADEYEAVSISKKQTKQLKPKKTIKKQIVKKKVIKKRKFFKK